MDHMYNEANRKELRQVFRRNMNRPEQVLWYHLRGSKINSLTFRRRYGIELYTLDFYCISTKLAIEIGGDSHYQIGEQQRDARRDNDLKQYGIQVLRFTNQDINTNIDGVLAVVASHLP